MLQRTIERPHEAPVRDERSRIEQSLRENDRVIRCLAEEAGRYELSFEFLWQRGRPYRRRFLVARRVVNVTAITYTKRSREGRLHAQTRIPHPRGTLGKYDLLAVVLMTEDAPPRLFAASRRKFMASGVHSIVIPVEGPAPNAEYLFDWHSHRGFSCLAGR